MSTDLTATVDRLLGLGDAAQHPAGAVAGVRTPASTQVVAGGMALLPGAGEDGAAMTPATLLDLASVTKVAATTVLVMRLVADGLLTLDTRVGTVLPGFGSGDEVTLEHLLTHTSGLPPWLPLYCETTDRAKALEAVRRTPLGAGPGRTWTYSDLGFILAGAVVEAVTGLRLDAAFAGLVAEPLGLANIGYGPVTPRLAAASADSDGYEAAMVASGRPYAVPYVVTDFAGWRPGPVRGEVSDGNAAHALGGVAGHAGLFADVGDLLRLGAALLPGAGFVPDPVVRRFASPTPVEHRQGVGFRRRVLATPAGPATMLWHGGFTGTFWGLAPDLGLVVAGGATRLHGTIGPLPTRPPAGEPALPRIVASDDIAEALLDGAVAASDGSAPTSNLTIDEER